MCDVAILNASVVTLDAGGLELKLWPYVMVGLWLLVLMLKFAGYIGGGTKVLDLVGKIVVPGFVDCHVHMSGFGQCLHMLNLRDVGSIEEMKRRLREYVERHPEKSWVIGGHWDHELFMERRYPTRWDLDEAVL